jgi:polar amino acid transport system substrate-binding protein
MSMRKRKHLINVDRLLCLDIAAARAVVARTLRIAAVTFATLAIVGQMGMETAQAGPLLDKAKAGQPIRIGYANIKPWCYESPDGGMHGFTNEIMLGALKAIGFDKVESVLITDWSGYIPGLQARQYDIASCGLYILGSRCKAVAFSNPIGMLTDSFLVPKGNPNKINSWDDVIKTKATVVMVSGTNNAEQAKKAGVPESQFMMVPSKNEVLQALYSGRAQAAAYAYLENIELANASNGRLEPTDPRLMPEGARNWPAIAFRQEDADFVKLFNEGLAKYLGTPEMIKEVADDLYTEVNLPEKGVTADWVCAHR